MRKLASIKKISNITPIKGADRIELAQIDGWKVVIPKNAGYSIGDLVVYCEIDSFLPIEPEFEFLRKSSYKKMMDKEGFRLKTAKFQNVISQGLIIPISDAITIASRNNDNVIFPIQENIDVTKLLGIEKYDPPIPAELEGTVKGMFPSFIQKTDETRIQSLVDKYDEWKESDISFYITEKIDGTSSTFYLKNNEFGVCGRNMEFIETETNTFWKVARQLDLENKMKSLNRNLAFQGELIGEGIQSNLYRIKGHTVLFFNVFDIDNYKKVGFDEFNDIMNELGLPTVPIVSLPCVGLPPSIDSFLNIANGSSLLYHKQSREGVVVRSIDNQISFKVISNETLLDN